MPPTNCMIAAHDHHHASQRLNAYTRRGTASGMLVRGWLAGAALSTARCTAGSLVVGERPCSGTRRTHWRGKAGFADGSDVEKAVDRCADWMTV